MCMHVGGKSLSLSLSLFPSLNLFTYLYIYLCRTVGLGTAFFQKTGRFGVHLRAGSGPTCVSHYKNRHFRGQMWQQQEAHPTGQELSFVETRT